MKIISNHKCERFSLHAQPRCGSDNEDIREHEHVEMNTQSTVMLCVYATATIRYNINKTAKMINL